jgi:transcriptional regulator GlxA family with amidase domain
MARTLPTRFGFLLINDFTLISMSSAVEPLRMANRICQKDIYQWCTISQTGNQVTASDGLSINVDDLDAIIVCGGRQVENHTTEPTLRWLVAASKSGMTIGAVCTGSYVLAKAGLLDQYHCSVHWENMATVSDLFPRVSVSNHVYTIDRDRMTSSGGTAPIDMMLHLIRQQCGPDVSASVAEQFVYDNVRESIDHQRVPLRHTIGNQSEKLVSAVELMEANIKEPISQTDLAAYVKLSRRQLQRLFHRYLNCTPSRHYKKIRLSRARQYLRQTNLSLVDISSQTGFGSSSHFSKSYKELYGYSPSDERRKHLRDV